MKASSLYGFYGINFVTGRIGLRSGNGWIRKPEGVLLLWVPLS